MVKKNIINEFASPLWYISLSLSIPNKQHSDHCCQYPHSQIASKEFYQSWEVYLVSMFIRI